MDAQQSNPRPVSPSVSANFQTDPLGTPLSLDMWQSYGHTPPFLIHLASAKDGRGQLQLSCAAPTSCIGKLVMLPCPAAASIITKCTIEGLGTAPAIGCTNVRQGFRHLTRGSSRHPRIHPLSLLAMRSQAGGEVHDGSDSSLDRFQKQHQKTRAAIFRLRSPMVH